MLQSLSNLGHFPARFNHKSLTLYIIVGLQTALSGLPPPVVRSRSIPLRISRSCGSHPSPTSGFTHTASHFTSSGTFFDALLFASISVGATPPLDDVGMRRCTCFLISVSLARLERDCGRAA